MAITSGATSGTGVTLEGLEVPQMVLYKLLLGLGVQLGSSGGTGVLGISHLCFTPGYSKSTIFLS